MNELLDEFDSFRSGSTGLKNPNTTTASQSISDEFRAQRKPSTDRTAGEVVKDTVAGVGVGVSNLGGTLGSIQSLVTGNSDNYLNRQADRSRDFYQGIQSEGLKAQQAELQEKVAAETTQFGKAYESIKGTVTNPSLLLNTAAEQLPNFIPGAAVGRAAGATALARGASTAGAGAIATGAAIGTGAVQQGADVGGETLDRVLDQSQEVFDANPEYQAQIANGATPEAAKQAIALSAGRAAAAQAGALSVGSNLLPGARVLDKALAGVPGSKGRIAGAISGALGEGASEALEEGGGQFLGNRQVQQVNADQSLSEGVGEAAGQGAVGGGLFGGISGALNNGQAAQPTQEQAPEQAPQLALPQKPIEIDGQGRPQTRVGAAEPITEIPPQPGAITDPTQGLSPNVAPESGQQEPATPQLVAPSVSQAPNYVDQNGKPVAGPDEVTQPRVINDLVRPGGVGRTDTNAQAPAPDYSRPEVQQPPQPESDFDTAFDSSTPVPAAKVHGDRAKKYEALAANEFDPAIKQDLLRQAEISKQEAKGEQPKLSPKERARQNRTVDVSKDDLLTAVAKLGGLDTSLENDFAGRLSHIKTPRGMNNIERPGKEGAKSLDELTESLIDFGYIDATNVGNGVDQSVLAEMLERAASGQKIYSLSNEQDYLARIKAEQDEEFDRLDLSNTTDFLTAFPEQEQSYLAQAEAGNRLDPAEYYSNDASKEAKTLTELLDDVESFGADRTEVEGIVKSMAENGDDTSSIMRQLFAYTEEQRNARQAETGQPEQAAEPTAEQQEPTAEQQEEAERGSIESAATPQSEEVDGSTESPTSDIPETRTAAQGLEQVDTQEQSGDLGPGTDARPDKSDSDQSRAENVTEAVDTATGETVVNATQDTEQSPEATPDQSLTPEQQADPQLKRDTDITGSKAPFRTEQAAKSQLSKRKLGDDYDVVPVQDGNEKGFALRKRETADNIIDPGTDQGVSNVESEQVQGENQSEVSDEGRTQGDVRNEPAPEVELSAQPDQANQQPDDFSLSTQTNSDILQQDADTNQRQADERQSVERAEQAKTADDFVLTGSNSEADQAAARGQLSLDNTATDTPTTETDVKADAQSIDIAANQASTSDLNDLPKPTEAQKEAGNYKVGKVKLNGLDISVENPKGSFREGVSPEGKPWKTEMKQHYGYVKGTEAIDGDHIDVFMSDQASNPDLPVFVVDQVDPETGKYDEPKVMIGFDSEQAATDAYQSNYDKGWKGLGAINQLSLDEFKAWSKSPESKKPISELPGQAPAVETEQASELPNAVTEGVSAPSTSANQFLIDGLGQSTAKQAPVLAQKLQKGEILNRADQDQALKILTKQQTNNARANSKAFKDAYAANVERLSSDTPSAAVADKPSSEQLDNKSASTVTLKGKTDKAKTKKINSTAEIEDFGKKIGGARKDQANEWANRVSIDVDMTTESLTKTFPQPDYAKLEESGTDKSVLSAVALIRAEIPAKPKRKLALERWTEQAEIMRSFARSLMSGDVTLDQILDKMNTAEYRVLKPMLEMIDVLVELPASTYPAISKNKYRFRHGKKRNPVTNEFDVSVDFLISHKDRSARSAVEGSTLAEAKANAVKYLKDKFTGEKGEAKAREKKRPEFTVYRDRISGKRFIGYKSPGGLLHMKEGFESAADAFEHINKNRDALEKQLAKHKEKPVLRRKTNEFRQGIERRKGDVKPDKFGETFGFFGVEFGNYVEGPRRQKDLNNAYDAFVDMAEALDIPTQALSLNGSLGVAFGARGRGGDAAAHFEPSKIAINLTKTSGPGSLAHEWLHGLDNYFARQDRRVAGRKPSTEFMSNIVNRKTAPDGVRQEVFDAMKGVVNSIEASGLPGRSAKIDAGRSKAYYNTMIEMIARSFEKYMVDGLKSKNIKNDYLANINEASGAYPTDAEMDTGLRDAFDKFFHTLDTKETDEGLALFDRSKSASTNAITKKQAAQTAQRITNKWVKGPKVNVVQSGAELPADILADAKAQGAPVDELVAAYKGNTLHIVAGKHKSERDIQESVFHEAYGHLGIEKLFGNDVNRVMGQVHEVIGGDAGLARLAKKYKVDISDYAEGTKNWTPEQRNALLTNELLAHIAQKETGTLGQKARELVAAIRQWLKDNGFTALAEFGTTNADQAVTSLLRNARLAVEGATIGTPEGNAARFMVAYHGTPHDVDKFSTDKIGTGEGAQAYGWGLYFADNKGVAEYYKNSLSGHGSYKGKPIELGTGNPAALVVSYIHNENLSKKEAQEAAIEELKSLEKNYRDDGFEVEANDHKWEAEFIEDMDLDQLNPSKGSLYEVNLKPKESEYLLWDKPLSEQSEFVKKAISKLPTQPRSLLIDLPIANSLVTDMHEQLEFGSPEKYQKFAGTKTTDIDELISKSLRKVGIKGTKYLDGISRAKGEGDYNYVIFDDADVDITAKFQRKRDATKSNPQVEQARKLAKDAKPVIKRFVKRNFTKEGLLNDAAFALKLDSDALKNVGEAEVAALVHDLEKSVTKAFGTKRYNQIDPKKLEVISEYMTARPEDKANIKLPKGVQETADNLRAYLDTFSGRMIEQIGEIIEFQIEDGASQEAIDKNIQLQKTIASNVGQYMNRSYQAFDDPKWKQKVLDNADLMSRAEAFISEQNPELDAGELTGAVRAILQSAADNGNFMSFLSKGAKQGSKDISITKKRKDVPPIIRELLGEYKDPKLNFARSASSMQWLIANHHFLADMRRQGLGVFLHKKPTGEFDKLVAGENSETMNPLDGLYSTVEFEQGLQDSANKFEGSELMRNLIGLNSMVKYGKTILSPTTQFRNLQSAAMFTAMNGHFNWKHMGKALAATKADLLTKDGEWRDYLNEMIGLGVLHDNPYAGELKDAIKDFTEMDTYAQGPKQNLKQFLGVMQKMYSAGDDFWKIIGFENELANLIDSGMPEAKAKPMAAERIRNGYPTYSQVPRAIKQIRRWPLIGTFVSFPYEAMRTTYNQVGFIKEDLAAGRKSMATKRMAGFAIASSSAYAVSKMSMLMMGMDDDDDEAIRNQMPPWSRNSQLVYLGYDDNGSPRYMDLSYLDPYTYLKKPLTALMSGNNRGIEKKITDAISELADPFIGADIAAGALGEIVFNKKLGGGSVYNEADTGGRKAAAILNHSWKAARPGVMNNIERTIKAIEGDVSASGREYTLVNEGLGWLGHRVSTLNVPQSIIYRSYEFSDTIRNATSILSRTAGRQNKLSDSQIKAAYSSMQKARTKAFTDMAKLVDGARRFGMSNKELSVLMKAARISEANRNAILRGVTPKWAMSKRFTQSAEQRAELTASDRKRKREIPKLMQERRELIRRLVSESRDNPNR